MRWNVSDGGGCDRGLFPPIHGLPVFLFLVLSANSDVLRGLV
jgi:hypothetical protein